MPKFAVEFTVPGGSNTEIYEAANARVAGLLCPTGQPIRVTQVSDDEEVTDVAEGETGEQPAGDQEQQTQAGGGGQEPDADTQADQAGATPPEVN